MNLAAKRVVPMLVCVACCAAVIADAQKRVSSPQILMEATNTLFGLGGHREQHLLVRLTTDGAVEWDGWADGKCKRQTGSISRQRVTEIERALKQVDTKSLHGTLGPYYVYVDTMTQLAIRVHVGGQDLTFTVENPWVGLPGGKSMPRDVRVVVCEVDKLYRQTAKEPTAGPCSNGTRAH